MARQASEIAVTEELAGTEARKLFAELLNRVMYRQDRIVLTRRGKRIAALVSVEDLDALEAFEDQADAKAAKEALRAPGKRIPASEVHAEVKRKTPPAKRRARAAG